jgi:hypothetical protein
MSRSSVWLGSLLLSLATATAAAIDLQVSDNDIEAILKIARGPESGRAAFHAPYVIVLRDPVVERIEVVTELRRLMLIAESRVASADHLFLHGTLRASEALRPWRGRISVIARLHFPAQNAYVLAPPLDLTLAGEDGTVPRLDFRGETLFGLGAGDAAPLPVVGAVAEAAFRASAIGQAVGTVTVRMNGRELVQVPVDFSRLP